VKVFYCDGFGFPLPEGHRFPITKFGLVREAVVAAGLVAPEELIVPEPIPDEAVLRVHDAEYLRRLEAGQLTTKEMHRIGLPWSPELMTRTRYAVGGTLAACRAALEDGIAMNLAGGTHHAFRDHGQGFCLFNDTVIAVRALQAEGRIGRALVLDCDVHQGNGTAALAADNPTLFTFSIHNEDNFPLFKVPSDLDIGLGDGTGDAEYLEALEPGVQCALGRADADLVLYLAGADPYEGDLWGRMALTKAGLEMRDRMVLERCRAAGLPVAVLMAGGYGRFIQDTVEIHTQTVRIAVEMARAWEGRCQAGAWRSQGNG
jgi:acetoin utilization deacetylase AcuC-like enzyme